MSKDLVSCICCGPLFDVIGRSDLHSGFAGMFPRTDLIGKNT